MEKVTAKEFKMLLAKRIKQLRTRLKLTQSELAIKIGYKDKQVINNYEINGANPTAFNLVLLAEALEVTVDELVNFSKLKDK